MIFTSYSTLVLSTSALCLTFISFRDYLTMSTSLWILLSHIIPLHRYSMYRIGRGMYRDEFVTCGGVPLKEVSSVVLFCVVLCWVEFCSILYNSILFYPVPFYSAYIDLLHYLPLLFLPLILSSQRSIHCMAILLLSSSITHHTLSSCEAVTTIKVAVSVIEVTVYRTVINEYLIHPQRSPSTPWNRRWSMVYI